MNVENFYLEIKTLTVDLARMGYERESNEISGAVASGSTGGEIFMHVRILLSSLICQPKVPNTIHERAAALVAEINETGW